MSELRITAGSLRGRRLPLPPTTRPTSERARQAFFNIVRERIEGARFLDLFAGSGIFSFEAVSRGAAEAVAIDRSPRNTATIARLAGAWKAVVKPITADSISGIKRLGEGVFDIVYADPPYDYEHYDDLLAAIDRDLPLAPGAIVAIEHRRKSNPFHSDMQRLEVARRAEYGEVWITFFRVAG